MRSATWNLWPVPTCCGQASKPRSFQTYLSSILSALRGILGSFHHVCAFLMKGRFCTLFNLLVSTACSRLSLPFLPGASASPQARARGHDILFTYILRNLMSRRISSVLFALFPHSLLLAALVLQDYRKPTRISHDWQAAQDCFTAVAAFAEALEALLP